MLNLDSGGAELSESRPGRFTLEETAPFTRRASRWVEHAAGLVVVLKRKISRFCWDLKRGQSSP